MKNYIGLVNDHSGSMSTLRAAAIADYNANITAIKEAASREMLDTIVSVVGIGLHCEKTHTEVKRQVVISNPHVLKPVTEWRTPGGTPLYDGIGNMIELFESLPDYSDENVSFLVIVTTDGQEYHSRKYNLSTISSRIQTLQRTGRWTFVIRVPKGQRRTVSNLGIPDGNIVEWETSQAGMAQSTVQTQQAMNTYYTARSAGARASTAFYANAASVDTSSLVDISKEVSLYVVPQDAVRLEIRDFVLKHRMEYLKGAAFYQLTKTESRVSHTKLIAVRDRSTGLFYAGADARKMIGLPTDRNARLHPGDHGNYDIFIQSESVNRLLVPGTGVMYWAKIGKQFTDADLAYLKPKAPVAPAAAAVVQLPAVPVSNRPTPSPIPPKAAVQPKDTVNGKPVKWFKFREECRTVARLHGTFQKDGNDFGGARGPNGQRWFYFV